MRRISWYWIRRDIASAWHGFWRFARRRPFVAGASVLLVVFVVYVIYLDVYITSRFKGRRWDLPAQVYARPLELYVGLTLEPLRMERELRRLGYQFAMKPVEPGTYYVRKNEIRLVSRPFRFWDGTQSSRRLVVEFDKGRVSGLSDGRGEIPIFRLAPLLVGSIYPGHGEDRLVVRPDQVPPLLPAALKVIEDRRFEDHYGVDPFAIMRAFVANIRAGEVTQGGSTLTQQLIKSYFLSNEQTLWRKIREALMAVILEVHFDKTDILNAYINEIYLAQDERRAIHGFGLGSQFYFSKPLGDLELHEIALLVAVVRGPSYYDPRRYPERALERRNLVLRLMADLDVVPQSEADQAAARPLAIWNRAEEGASYYPGFTELVRRQLATQYREDDLTNEGLQVFTTLDPMIQADAEKTMAKGLARLDQWHPEDEQELEGAAVITSAQNSEVLAIVGGRRAGFDGFNRALDARRPIGSLVKPVVYLAALQSGDYTLKSLIDDTEIDVELENGDIWSPKNFDNETHGEVTLVRALVESFNMATVRLGIAVGVENIAELLHRLGAPEKPPAYPSLLLGAVELAPVDVAQIYNTLATGGFRSSLRAVRSVVDAYGEPIQRYPLEIGEVADPAAVYQLNQALVEVMRRGTGQSAKRWFRNGPVTAGKTGTSDQYRDSWFAGFTGEHVMVVWVGYDDNHPAGLTGATGALSIWAPMMSDLDSSSYAPLPPPRLDRASIDFDSGFADNGERNIGKRAKEWFEAMVD